MIKLSPTPYTIYDHRVDVIDIVVDYCELLHWCNERCTLGWNHIGRYFYFEHEEDKVLFMLTWG